MSYEVIEHIEVGSGGQASIEFVSVGDIPSDYTDLLILVSARSTRSGQYSDGLKIVFNSDGTNSSSRYLLGYNNSVSSGTRTILSGGSITAALATSSTFSSNSIYIPNYRSSVAKSISTDGVAETNGTQGAQIIEAGLWNNTSPITSIVLSSETGNNFVQYSSATLYGVTAGSDGTTTVS